MADQEQNVLESFLSELLAVVLGETTKQSFLSELLAVVLGEATKQSLVT